MLESAPAMPPAASIAFFTVVSGAGCGLLFALALLAAGGPVAPDEPLGLVGLGMAVALAAAGPPASAARFDGRERACRAMPGGLGSQFGRGGAIAVLIFASAGLLASLFFLGDAPPTTQAILGIASAAGAATTVFAMAMVHRRSLPMPARLSRFLAPGYLAVAAATGALLAQAVLGAYDADGDTLRIVAFGAIVALAAAMRVKLAYWSVLDTVTASGASSSPDGGPMVRRHAIGLRRIVLGGMFLPAALTLLGLMSPSLMPVAAVLAALLGLAGAALERWLLFADVV